jgi:DNA-binding MarR family transcriptional regulator
MTVTNDIERSPVANDYVLEQSLTHLLHRAGQCATETFQKAVGNLAITARQFAVLQALANNEGASQTDLSDATGIDRSTLADIVRRLLEKGLLERQRSRTDARAYVTRLTDEGHKHLDTIRPIAQGCDARLMASLSPEQRRSLVDVLDTIIKAHRATAS